MSSLSIPSSLVSTDWLYENLHQPNLIILDATLPKVGQAASTGETISQGIPNARFFDLKNVFKDKNAAMPNTIPGAEYFETEVRKLGVNRNSVVVIYDRHGTYSSPRAWWLFKVMGHDQVAVLNGGLPEWKMEKKTLTDLQKYNGPVGNFVSSFREKMVVKDQEVLQAIDVEDKLLLDARSAGRFHATEPEPRAELRGGHIPNSKSLPHTTVVRDGKLLSTKELKEVFSEKEVGEKQLTFSCGSGITACILALAADQIGLQDFNVYDGSWTEWASNLELPINP